MQTELNFEFLRDLRASGKLFIPEFTTLDEAIEAMTTPRNIFYVAAENALYYSGGAELQLYKIATVNDLNSALSGFVTAQEVATILNGYYTALQVDAITGNIAAALDLINGENI